MFEPKNRIGETSVKTASLVLVLFSLSLLIACGGGGQSGGSGSTSALTLSPLASSMPVNTTQQFTAIGSYSDGSSRDLTALVTWSSSAPSNATIDATGLVTSVAAGSTTISATLGSVRQSTTLTVTNPTITSISITPDGLTLGIGINQQYTVTATYSDLSRQDLVTGVTWSSL